MKGAREFAKWGLDFVGPIKPLKRSSHMEYIIVATNYLTKWAETNATIRNNARITTKFLYETIFTHYGIPIDIMCDQSISLMK